MQVMRITKPEVCSDGRLTTVQARVRGLEGAPDALWFRYPATATSLIEDGIEPFLVALSSRAALAHIPIEVDGPISERLHAGLDEYWRVFSCWRPGVFAPVEVRHGGFCTRATHGLHLGAAFSGGVDSFFTLFRHTARGEPALEPAPQGMAYALFVHGLDITLEDEATYRVAADAYEQALAPLGVKLLRVATNIRQFIRDWEYSHGSALCGTAMITRRAIRRFLVPSSKTYTTLEPWGSDPLVDPLLSSDGFDVVHDGAAFSRFDKLHAMREWPVIRPLLRTCYAHPDGLANCGRCANCLRTMLVLEALGVLDQFPTFPGVPSPRVFAGTSWQTPHERLFGRQAVEYAASRGASELARVGKTALARSRSEAVFREVRRRLKWKR